MPYVFTFVHLHVKVSDKGQKQVLTKKAGHMVDCVLSPLLLDLPKKKEGAIVVVGYKALCISSVLLVVRRIWTSPPPGSLQKETDHIHTA